MIFKRTAVILLGVAGIWAAALLYLVTEQRSLMYFPSGMDGAPISSGLKGTSSLTLTTPDGERLTAWHHPPSPGKPIFLYFHGNGGNLAERATWLRVLAKDGSGYLAVDYRGYGDSTGSPTEMGLIADGETAYAEALALGYDTSRIVILGESLGTGVAVAVAARHPSAAVILDSSYSSLAEVAWSRFPIFPIGLVMKDQFRSMERIGSVAAPKLFLHGTRDQVIPIAYGQSLYDAAHEPKRMIEVDGGTHVVLWDPGILDRARVWLAGLSEGAPRK